MDFGENLKQIQVEINSERINLNTLSGVVDEINKGLRYTNSLLVKDMAKCSGFPGLFDVSVGQVNKNIPPRLEVSSGGRRTVVFTYLPGESFRILYSPGYSNPPELPGILYTSEAPVCESHCVSVTSHSKYICGIEEILKEIDELNAKKTDINVLLENAGLLEKQQTDARSTAGSKGELNTVHIMH